MNFVYNREYQTLEVTSDTGVIQNIHIPEQYLEKLYFYLGGALQDADTFTVHRSGVADVKFSNVRWRGLDG